jgi:hypothetical protein
MLFIKKKKQLQKQKLKQCHMNNTSVFEELDVDFFETWKVTK